MLLIYYFTKPVFWIIPWILQSIGYFRVLRKVDMDGKWAIVPFAAEGKLSTILFESMSSYWHPLVIAGLNLAAGMYMSNAADKMSVVTARLLIIVALIVYGIFLINLYWRLGKCFKKSVLFRIGMIMLPALFLILLGSKKSVFYGGPVFKRKIIRARWIQIGFTILRELGFAAVFVVSFGVVGFLTLRNYMPEPVVYLMLQDFYETAKDVKGDGSVMLRNDTMGDAYHDLASFPTSRDYFFPDHSKDESVVVMEYVIGSNLEDAMGMATINLRQMLDATEQGSALKFVVEAGGTKRWFTSGVKHSTVGLYEIADGKLTMKEDLGNKVYMCTEDELYNFITWTKENYPADRYMLVLWDHGGGLPSGYGQDVLNERKDTKYGALPVNEIVSAIDRAGVKFDMIGFDACLMQDIEIAVAMEPYADYYLASEETESGEGWFYTSAFGMLAKDPTTSMEEFGKEIISAYDVNLRVMHERLDNSGSTLSLIDLTRIRPVFDKLMALYEKEHAAFLADSADYADISIAAGKATAFTGDEQIDLVDYLELLDHADYNDSIATPEEIKEVINYVKASIVCRNAMSHDGINGLAVSFPYKMIASYGRDHIQYEKLGMETCRKLYDDFFSIMAAVRKLEFKAPEIFGFQLPTDDYTKEEWYIKDFENYETTQAVVDIPLVEKEDGWQMQLPDTAWNIIAEANQVVYMKTEDGWMYLGRDIPAAYDENDHPMVAATGRWVHINGQVVNYEAQPAVTNENGVIQKGTVRASLNGEEITLYIEWDPVVADDEIPTNGHVIGYRLTNEDSAFMEKGLQELKPGEVISFLFDYYDEEGKVVKTDTHGHSIRLSSMSNLKVTDEPIGECDLRYGVVMQDVYQRTFTSEFAESHFTK